MDFNELLVEHQKKVGDLRHRNECYALRAEIKRIIELADMKAVSEKMAACLLNVHERDFWMPFYHRLLTEDGKLYDKAKIDKAVSLTERPQHDVRPDAAIVV